jgi:uncharacterized protein (DUF362 family)
LDRRVFLKNSLGIAAATSLATPPLYSWMARAAETATQSPILVCATGASPADNVRRAIVSLGSIEKFVSRGSTVLLKPNSMNRFGETYAVNTNPAVVGEVAKLCRLAGASQVMAITHDEAAAWKSNGIGQALKVNGATYRSANNRGSYQSVALPKGKLLQLTEILKELLEADVYINIPVAKQSPEVFITAGLKNTMGLNWDRQIMHDIGLHQTIADLASVRRPDLTIVDCTRILLSNGPYGPGEVRECNQVLASADPVAADSYAATLFKLEPGKVDHLCYAHELGLGELDLKKVDIRMV